MNKILHLSDLHFGTEDPQVVLALQQLAEEQQTQLNLLSGDITQRARRRQFADAVKFMQQLPGPTLAVPGNHDLPLFNLPARVFNPYGNYRRAFGERLEPLYETSELLVIGLNTTHPARHVDGAVTQAQIERVSGLLNQAKPEQLRIIMQHHPVCAVEGSDVANLLINREQAVPAWTDAGMDILLAGHIHLPYILPLQGTQNNRRAWAVQAGTGVSQRIRGNVPNSVNVIEYLGSHTEPSCCLARWDYAADNQRFELVRRSPLALSRPTNRE